MDCPLGSAHASLDVTKLLHLLQLACGVSCCSKLEVGIVKNCAIGEGVDVAASKGSNEEEDCSSSGTVTYASGDHGNLVGRRSDVVCRSTWQIKC